MTMLVTLDEAKDQVRIMRTNTDFDDDLELKVYIASDVLLDYLKLSEVPDEWYDDHSPANLDTPPLIKGAVLLMTAELFLNREASVANVLSDFIKQLLKRYRDPAIA